MKNLKIKKIVFNTKVILLTAILGTSAIFTSCTNKNNTKETTFIQTEIIDNNSDIVLDSNNTIEDDHIIIYNNKEEINNNNANIIIDNNKEDIIVEEEKIEIEEDPVSNNLPLDIKVNYTNENNIIINNYINSIDTYYNYEELFELDKALIEYNNLNFVDNHECKINNLNANELYNSVIENNKSISNFLYEEIPESSLKNVCEFIVIVANDFINADLDIDEETVKCVLSDLKIVSNPTALYNAAVTDDGTLVLSPNMLSIVESLSFSTTDVVVHEIVHLLQKGCKCDLKNNSNLQSNFGIGYEFNNLNVNSLDFSWLYEASAEKCMTNYTGSRPMTYIKMINYLESLSLVNVLNDDSYPIEYLCFNKDINDLYDYFNVSTKEDKEEILKLLYSIEIMQMAPHDFYNRLNITQNVEVDNNLVDKVNYEIKESICTTLTKLFYKNLSNNIVNKDTTLNDIFYLIKLFEDDLSSHNHYNDSNLYEYNEVFFEKYLNIQDNFFHELSKVTGYSEEEIINSYNNYSGYEYKLKFVDENRKNYLESRKDYLYSHSTSTVRECYNTLSKNLQKVYN